MKTCTKCKTSYLLTKKSFSSSKHYKDGFQTWCKKCFKKYDQKYRQSKKGKEACEKAVKKYHNTINGHLHKIYAHLKLRCTNPKYEGYKNYGGRGIKNKFESSDKFVDYVINELKIDPRGLQIDRIDNNGHYEKGNIRFVTAKINANNRRR